MKVSKSLPEVQRLVDRLEQHGYKIRLSHDSDRTGVYLGESGNHLPYHGYTCISIDHETNGVHVDGGAFCSVNDQFSRAEGTRIAFDRALTEMHDWVGRDELKSILG